jgi:hypothetical protein
MTLIEKPEREWQSGSRARGSSPSRVAGRNSIDPSTSHIASIDHHQSTIDNRVHF